MSKIATGKRLKQAPQDLADIELVEKELLKNQTSKEYFNDKKDGHLYGRIVTSTMHGDEVKLTYTFNNRSKKRAMLISQTPNTFAVISFEDAVGYVDDFDQINPRITQAYQNPIKKWAQELRKA